MESFNDPEVKAKAMEMVNDPVYMAAAKKKVRHPLKRRAHLAWLCGAHTPCPICVSSHTACSFPLPCAATPARPP